MEGLNTLLDLLSGSEFLTTIDLKDGYFLIPIHADHYKYLRFEWNSTLFELICLPFGLSLVPRVFTKVLKPFVASIRNKGIRLVIYLDDMAIISSFLPKGWYCCSNPRVLRIYYQQGKIGSFSLTKDRIFGLRN